MQELAFEIAAPMLTIAGVALIAWALLWDPARRQRRCPKCWYDMSAAGQVGEVGVRCPECGRVTRRERALHTRRRRWRWALGSVTVLMLAYAAVATPRVRDRGWVGAVPTTGLALVYPLLFDHADAHDVSAAIDRLVPQLPPIPVPRRRVYVEPGRDLAAPTPWKTLLAAELLGELCARVREEQVARWQFSVILRMMLELNADAIYSGIHNYGSARYVCGHVLLSASATGLMTDDQAARLDARDEVRIELPEVVIGDSGVSARIDARFWSRGHWQFQGSLEVYDHVATKWRRIPETYARRTDDRIRWVETAWIDGRCIGPEGEVRFRADVWSIPQKGSRVQRFKDEWKMMVRRVAKGASSIKPVSDEAMEGAIAHHFSPLWFGALVEESYMASGFSVSLIHFGNSVYMNHPETKDHRREVRRPNQFWSIEPPEDIFAKVFDGAIGLRYRLLVAGSPIAEGAVAWENFERMIYDTGGLPGGSSMWSGPGVDVELAVLPDAPDIWARAEAGAGDMEDMIIELEVSGDPNVAKRFADAQTCLVFTRRFRIQNQPHEHWGMKRRIFYATSRPLPWRDSGPIGPPEPAGAQDP